MTALITTQVRATYAYPNGSPVVGAKVVANLSKFENDNGLVVPTSITSLTDENGSATLLLWPNSRGVGGSTYSIYISKDNKTIWSGTVVVPELSTIVDVHTILQTTATPALDAAQIAVLQAQEYAAQAAASADAAALSGGGGSSGGVDIASVKDVSNGIAGLTLFKINLFNALGSVKSFITTLATAPRTYTFPDKDITVAGLSDITGTNTGTNTGDETATTIKTKLGITTISGDNTGDESSSSIKTKLGITTISGDNTGDETAASIKTKLGVTTLSGSNTGDETTATIKSKLGVTVLSGSNTGDQTLTSLGIPNVENKSSSDIRGEITSGNVTTALGYTPVTPTALNTHTTDQNNPHLTTKVHVGLSAVDNTSDANKPVSTAQQTALNLKADLTSNTFSGPQIYSDQVISRAMMKDMGCVFVDKGNSGTTAQVVDYSAGSHQKITTTGAFSLSFSNWPPSGNTGYIHLDIVNGNSSVITWPTINWEKPDGNYTTTFSTYLAANGTRTALQTSGTDTFLFFSRDGGTTIVGRLV